MDNSKAFYTGGVVAIVVYTIIVGVIFGFVFHKTSPKITQAIDISLAMEGSVSDTPQVTEPQISQPLPHQLPTSPQTVQPSQKSTTVPLAKTPPIKLPEPAVNPLKNIDISQLNKPQPLQKLPQPTQPNVIPSAVNPASPPKIVQPVKPRETFALNATSVSSGTKASSNGLSKLHGILLSRWAPKSDDAGRTAKVKIDWKPGQMLQFSVVSSSGSLSYDERLKELLAQLRDEHVYLGSDPIDAVLIFKARE